MEAATTFQQERRSSIGGPSQQHWRLENRQELFGRYGKARGDSPLVRDYRLMSKLLRLAERPLVTTGLVYTIHLPFSGLQMGRGQMLGECELA
jgi:hypothetical protein